MFSKEVMVYLGKLLSSWQVIAITLALLIYFKLVFYVANARRTRSYDFSSTARVKQKKEKKVKEKSKDSSDTDELGLSED